jgi:hypothetical protein
MHPHGSRGSPLSKPQSGHELSAVLRLPKGAQDLPQKRERDETIAKAEVE